MRLPSNILAKLYLSGLAVTAACEPAHRPETCETKPKPIVSPSELDEEDVDETKPTHEPAVAPRYPEPHQVQPQPSQPQPQPVVKKKPKRKVWVSVCGHMELADEGTGASKCGMG